MKFNIICEQNTSINVLDTENSVMYSSNTLNVKPIPEVTNDEEVSKDVINK